MQAQCPNCNRKSIFLFNARDLNRRVSNETFTYRRCPDCGLIFLAQIPDNISDYYQQEYYRIPSQGRLRKVARAQKYQLDLIRKFVTSGHLLEIGPAVGYFAYQAKQAGFKIDTVEQDARCCEYLTTVVGVNAIRSDSPHTIIDTMDSHDVITMWHVIEHLQNPWACLKSAAKNLIPGGILLIATPNPAAFQFRILSSLWPHIDAPRHVYLFPKDLLIQRLQPLGLEPVMIVSKDRGITYLNRFGWQRFLTCLFPRKLQAKIGFIFGYMGGYLISFTMKIWETRELCGSAYTIVFRKKGSDPLN